MPHIEFEPTGAGAGWGFSLDGEPPKDELGGNCEGVGWAVKGSDSQRVRLSTGGELKKLPGRIYFRAGDATPEGRAVYEEGAAPSWGVLSYFEPDENPNHYPVLPVGYGISLYVSRALLDRLRSLVAAGMLPKVSAAVGSRISLDPNVPKPPDKDAIRYGWEPDGSGLEWDNKSFPHLEVRWCSFRVEVGLPNLPDDETMPDRSFAPPTRADMVRVTDAVEKASRQMEQQGRSLTSAAWLCVILLAIIVFRRYL